MEKITNLAQVPLNKQVEIKKLTCTGAIKQRLLDLVLVTVTKIEPILVSPSKDPRAFLVRGTIIAIRKEDAEGIGVWPNLPEKRQSVPDPTCRKNGNLGQVSHELDF